MKTFKLNLYRSFSVLASLLLLPHVTASDKYPLANTNQTKTNFAVMLDPNISLSLGEQSSQIVSKSYYQSVSGDELSKGVTIVTSGKGAVVRLTPIANEKRGLSRQSVSIDPSELSIISAAGEVKANSESMALMADSTQLKQTYPELFQNTSAFKMSDAMGTGTFTIKTSQNLDKSAQYMINVFDKNSPHSLELESKNNSYQFNDKLKIRSKLKGISQQHAMRATAELVAPDGRRWPLTIKQQGDHSVIESVLDMSTERKPGTLWKVVVDVAVKGSANAIKRTAELALDIHSTTAKVKRFKMSKNSGTLQIDVMRPGRYEARAWIFAQDANQVWQPAMLVYGADWFEPGVGQIQLPFDTQKLAAAGFSGKVKVGQVQLLDQSRLAVLATRKGNWQRSNENALTNR